LVAAVILGNLSGRLLIRLFFITLGYFFYFHLSAFILPVISSELLNGIATVFQ
jgi:hypothetical protein